MNNEEARKEYLISIYRELDYDSLAAICSHTSTCPIRNKHIEQWESENKYCPIADTCTKVTPNDWKKFFNKLDTSSSMFSEDLWDGDVTLDMVIKAITDIRNIFGNASVAFYKENKDGSTTEVNYRDWINQLYISTK